MQARLAARQQWVNRVHDERIKVYLDLYADCHDRERWLTRLTRPYVKSEWDNAPALHVRQMAIHPRILLLAPGPVGAAWARVVEAQELLYSDLVRRNWPDRAGDLVAVDDPALVAVRDRLTELYAAVQDDMAGPGRPQGR